MDRRTRRTRFFADRCSDRYELGRFDWRRRLRSWSVSVFLAIDHSHGRMVTLRVHGRVNTSRSSSFDSSRRVDCDWVCHIRRCPAFLPTEPFLEQWDGAAGIAEHRTQGRDLASPGKIVPCNAYLLPALHELGSIHRDAQSNGKVNADLQDSLLRRFATGQVGDNLSPQTARKPPSTFKTAPVTMAVSGDSIMAMVRAISSTSAKRPIG